ncbi:restriction endonuclease subunit S [Methylophaga thiooxydans]|uniref:Type I restriction modification DNA specificity domain protein n=1 Tax=Methylophaga thiooxydans DMS010 TaxID=637616 RepID=C0N6G4_9GAMM|nr:restriction endonuclease subunit S [Methylophaga thiooxydans]EEF79357.1 Type I restriction modification DNA specificity domain protein [Methylophaga thiooxydans DMS010]
MPWSSHKLGDFCEVIAGQSPEGKYYNDSGDGLPFYQGKKEFGERYIGAPQKWTTKITKKANSGDILMSVRAPVGPINISIEQICIGRGLAAIRASDKLDRDFLFYYLLSKQDEIQGNEGAVFASINKSQIEELSISYVDLKEQKRIVAILDQAFADIDKARALTEQNLKNARELFESYLQQVFNQLGEEVVQTSLGNICSFKHGFAFKSEYFVDDSALVLLTPGNFYEEGGYRDRGHKQKYYDGPFPQEFLLSKGDLLVAMTEQAEGLLGSPALIPEDEVFLHNQRLGLVDIKSEYSESVDLEFLYHLFNTKYFRAKVQETASGLKVRHTSPKKMEAIKVSIPTSLNQQKTIAKSLFNLKEKCNQLESIYLLKQAELEDLKNSLLQKAFSGELTKDKQEAAA